MCWLVAWWESNLVRIGRNWKRTMGFSNNLCTESLLVTSCCAPIGAALVKTMFAPIEKQGLYEKQFRSNVNELNREVKELKAIKERMRQLISEEEIKGRIMYPDIRDWLQDVEDVINTANQILEDPHNNVHVGCSARLFFPIFSCCLTIRRKLSRRLVKTREVVLKLQCQGKWRIQDGGRGIGYQMLEVRLHQQTLLEDHQIDGSNINLAYDLLRSNVSELNREVKELKAISERMRQLIAEEEIKGRILYPDIGDWFQDVEDVIKTANQILEYPHNKVKVGCSAKLIFQCFPCCLTIQHKLSRRAVKTREVVLKLQCQGKWRIQDGGRGIGYIPSSTVIVSAQEEAPEIEELEPLFPTRAAAIIASTSSVNDH